MPGFAVAGPGYTLYTSLTMMLSLHFLLLLTLQTTTEMQGGLFYEPQGDEDPPATADLSLSQPDAVKPELTDTAPPAYIEAISYATIQDKKEPPPPFVNSTL